MPQDNEVVDEEPQAENGIPLRKNVLALMGIAYSILFLIFAVVAIFDTPSSAYGIIGGPFVALIGGTLAIAKDLVK